MRELTSAEIEDFDFSGRIPELNVAPQTVQRGSRQRVQSFAPSSRKTHRLPFGATRTA